MNLPSTSKLLYFCFLLMFVGAAVYLSYGLNIYHNDAISRTALAFFTTFGRNPHLAAIGFVWQPLPSLIQLPVLILLRGFNLILLSGPLTTAFAGSLSVVCIYKIGALLNINRGGGKTFLLIVALLFGINPMIILYSSVGTSEMIFICTLLLSSYYFLKWSYETKQQHLLLASLFISLSFWSRYESLPAFVTFCFLILLKALAERFGQKKIESSLLQFILPFLYSVFFWLLLNWLVMKDAFYFMNSPYSNSAFTEIFKTNPSYLEHSYHSLLNSFVFVGKRALYLAPSLILLIATPFLFYKLRIEKKLRELFPLLFLSLPYLAILVFHVYQLYKGESFGWLRFYIYAIAAGSLTALYFGTKNKILACSSVILILIGTVTTAYAMTNPQLGREEESFVHKLIDPSTTLDFSRTYEDQKKVAYFTDKLGGKIMLDTDKGFAIPLFSRNPEKFVITSDIDYIEIVRNYTSYVNWIIVPKPATDDRGQNKIYTYYPGIWEGNAPRTQLYAQIDDWRVYKVLSQREILNKEATENPDVSQPKTQCEYVVEDGDSLWKIAKNKLGYERDYLKIIELNDGLSQSPSLIHPKDVLIIPCIQNTPS